MSLTPEEYKVLRYCRDWEPFYYSDSWMGEEPEFTIDNIGTIISALERLGKIDSNQDGNNNNTKDNAVNNLTRNEDRLLHLAKSYEGTHKPCVGPGLLIDGNDVNTIIDALERLADDAPIMEAPHNDDGNKNNNTMKLTKTEQKLLDDARQYMADWESYGADVDFGSMQLDSDEVEILIKNLTMKESLPSQQRVPTSKSSSNTNKNQDGNENNNTYPVPTVKDLQWTTVYDFDTKTATYETSVHITKDIVLTMRHVRGGNHVNIQIHKYHPYSAMAMADDDVFEPVCMAELIHCMSLACPTVSKLNDYIAEMFEIYQPESTPQNQDGTYNNNTDPLMIIENILLAVESAVNQPGIVIKTDLGTPPRTSVDDGTKNNNTDQFKTGAILRELVIQQLVCTDNEPRLVRPTDSELRTLYTSMTDFELHEKVSPRKYLK